MAGFFTNQELPFSPKPDFRTTVDPVKARVHMRGDGFNILRKEVLFNPTTFSMSVKANYATQNVPGSPAQILQWINTANPVMPLQFVFDELTDQYQKQIDFNDSGTIGPRTSPAERLARVKRLTNHKSRARRNFKGRKFESATDFNNFFLAFVYPDAADRFAVKQFRPPRMVFIWPGFITVTGAVRDVGFDYNSFAQDGRLLRVVANIKIEILRARPGLNARKVADDGFRFNF